MNAPNKFDTFDTSSLDLPKNEPLCQEIIDDYKILARHVIEQALKDLTSSDPLEQRTAQRFCLADDPAHHEMRMLWLGWLGMTEATLANAATLRLQWNANANPAGPSRQRRVLPAGEARPPRRSRPIQPEGLSYRA